MQKSRLNELNQEASTTIRTSTVSYLNKQPMAKTDGSHLQNMKYVKKLDFANGKYRLF